MNLFSAPGGTALPEVPPLVAVVNWLPSDTVWRSENDITSRGDEFGPDSRPIRRCVSEYSTECRTIGRNGVSTVSNRITRSWSVTTVVYR